MLSNLPTKYDWDLKWLVHYLGRHFTCSWAFNALSKINDLFGGTNAFVITKYGNKMHKSLWVNSEITILSKNMYIYLVINYVERMSYHFMLIYLLTFECKQHEYEGKNRITQLTFYQHH